MARYELTEEQVRALKVLLATANIKGSEAPTIINLARALDMPVKEKASPPKPEVPK